MSEPLSGPDRIRVVTYNLRDLKDDQRAIERVLSALKPDVACLQEVPRHPFSGHRIGALADACGLLWSGGGVRSGGTAVLTSLRVDQHSSYAALLPVRGRFTRSRGFASAVMAVPGGPAVTVASVHLSLLPDERRAHARMVLEQVQASGPAPYVIAGDLNGPPDGPSWRVFGTALDDAVAVSGNLEGAAPTYPARSPKRRIDAVLVSKGVVVQSIRVPGPDDGIDPADLVMATDHLPVIADLQIPAPPVPPG